MVQKLVVFITTLCLLNTASSYVYDFGTSKNFKDVDQRTNLKDYPEIVGKDHVVAVMGQKTVTFSFKTDFIYSEDTADGIGNIKKSMFKSWIQPSFPGVRLKKKTMELFHLDTKYNNNNPGFRRSFNHSITIQFPAIEAKHARRYNVYFSQPLHYRYPQETHTVKLWNAALKKLFIISLHDFIIKQRINAVGFRANPVVYSIKMSQGVKRRPAIFLVGSDVRKYRITCDCDEGKGEKLKYMRAAWKFHHRSGMGGRAASEVPRGVVASRISFTKLALRITSLQDSIEGWYHCEWRSLRAWDRPFSSPELKMIPYDDDSCKVMGAVNKGPLCHKDATCIDSRFTYHCVCNDGYTGDGKKYCDDIDECSRGVDMCDVNAQCTNKVGDYVCHCDIGYTGDGWTCSLTDFDPDEAIEVYYRDKNEYNETDMGPDYLTEDIGSLGNLSTTASSTPVIRASRNTSKLSPGVIAAVTVGLTTLAAAVVVAVFFWRRRKSSLAQNLVIQNDSFCGLTQVTGSEVDSYESISGADERDEYEVDSYESISGADERDEYEVDSYESISGADERDEYEVDSYESTSGADGKDEYDSNSGHSEEEYYDENGTTQDEVDEDD